MTNDLTAAKPPVPAPKPVDPKPIIEKAVNGQTHGANAIRDMITNTASDAASTVRKLAGKFEQGGMTPGQAQQEALGIVVSNIQQALGSGQTKGWQKQ